MSFTTTVAPAAAKRRVMPPPIPAAPPVTTATRPSRSFRQRPVRHAGFVVRGRSPAGVPAYGPL